MISLFRNAKLRTPPMWPWKPERPAWHDSGTNKRLTWHHDVMVPTSNRKHAPAWDARLARLRGASSRTKPLVLKHERGAGTAGSGDDA